jgi:hypothetical protein
LGINRTNTKETFYTLTKRRLLPQQTQFLKKDAFFRLRRSFLLDIGHWRSAWDISLSLKQARKTDDGKVWIRADEYQCRKAFHHFMNIINRKVFGKAFCRYGRRLNVIPVLEKKKYGRWHYHAAIEPPAHIDAYQFDQLITDCWSQTDWGYERILVREGADRGWVTYMLKSSQKSDFDAWSDAIDWESLHNKPIVGA